MKVEIKDKALIKNLQILSKVKVDGRVYSPSEITENALTLFFTAINKRVEKANKYN